jgi:hypothetical protein
VSGIVKRGAAAELAHDVVDMVAADFSRPAFRAGMAVTMVSTIMLARMGARPFMTVVTSVMLGAAAERAYATVEEISAKLGGDYVDNAD